MKAWMGKGCRQRLLVQTEVGSVMECSCGKLHLKLGYLSLHFDQSGMAALGDLLGKAVQTSGRRRERAESDMRLFFGDMPKPSDDPDRLD